MNLRNFLNSLSYVISLVALNATVTATGADWPQFLGPARNGHYPGNDIADTWAKNGPATLWQRKIGQGFSGPVAADGKLILFHRLSDKEIIECLEMKSGQTLWKFQYPATYRDDFGFDEGPRATPGIHGEKVFTLGAAGMLHCVDFATGKKVWSIDTQKEFGARKGFFGFACSPLIDSEKVYLNIGGTDGAGIVAFDTSTGKLLWKATDHEASYSSAVAATIESKPQILFFTRNGLVATDPQSGRISFEFPWRSRTHASVNAATPLVFGNEIFLSTSYETGAVLLRVNGGKVQKIWSSDEVLSSHYATSVYRDGFLYGYHGRQERRPALRCIEWTTGKVRWSEDDFGAGTVTLAGDRLLLVHEDGRLALAEAMPDKFKLLGQAQILPTGVRAYPAWADGLFFARSKDKLVCADLRKNGPK
jgi:outer membrane protein assembly factor BamB